MQCFWYGFVLALRATLPRGDGRCGTQRVVTGWLFWSCSNGAQRGAKLLQLWRLLLNGIKPYTNQFT